jgi:hypothetical protein
VRIFEIVEQEVQNINYQQHVDVAPASGNNATPTDTIYGKTLRANSMQAKHENHGPIFQHQILKSTNPLPTRQSVWFL